jgi:ABC-type multidrug transport system ATPase subunit
LSDTSALRDLRRLRAERRRAKTGRFDAFYRVYVVLFFGAMAFAFGNAAVKINVTGPLTVGDLRQFSALLGLLTALLVVNGTRTGRLGGPLMISRPDVHHVLLSPADRAAVLRPIAFRYAGRALGLGTLAGMAAGFFVGRGLPGGSLAWMASLGTFGLLSACVLVGAGIATAGLRVRRADERVIAVVFVVVGAGGLALRRSLLPLSYVATWPFDRHPAALAAVVAPALAFVGLLLVGRISLEGAERRGELVSASRVSLLVTRDLRATLLYRRRLLSEHARRRPWVRFASGGPVVRRDLRGLERIPTARIVRFAGLVTLAGMSVAISRGRIVFFLAAGVLHFLIALDLIEGFAEEFDHPDLRDAHPVRDGPLSIKHLVVPVVAMACLTVVSCAVVPALLDAGLSALDVSAPLGLVARVAPLAGVSAVLAAGVTLLDPRPITTPFSAARPQEFAGVSMAARFLAAPAMASAGMLPVLASGWGLRLGGFRIPAVGVVIVIVIGEVALAAWFRVRVPAIRAFERILSRMFSMGAPTSHSDPHRFAGAGSPNEVLTFVQLTKTYADTPVLGPLDAEVGPGQVCVLIGPNGAGKTTLLRTCAGLLDPTDGAALVRGLVAGTLGARRLVSFVPDVPVFYEDLSLTEHVEFVCRLHATSDWEPKMRDLVGRFDLADRTDDLPVLFSRGMKQKAALVIGLCRPFDVLLLDEPLANVDQAARRVLLGVVAELGRGGRSAVMATHDLDALAIATNHIALRDGQLVSHGHIPDDIQQLMA